MSEGILSEFLDGAGDMPFRNLVQALIGKLSTMKLSQFFIGEVLNLPRSMLPKLELYIDAINERFGYDKEFWEEVTCLDAFIKFMFIAFEFLPISDRIKSIESSFDVENQEIAFGIFQLTTLSFAHSASTQKKQRKFMGIRKGFFR